jgi:hypothetical protein
LTTVAFGPPGVPEAVVDEPAVPTGGVELELLLPHAAIAVAQTSAEIATDHVVRMCI